MKKVVIIGGGFAGINLAAGLAENANSPTIYCSCNLMD